MSGTPENHTIDLNELKKMIPEKELEEYLKEAEALKGRNIIEESSLLPIKQSLFSNTSQSNKDEDPEKKRKELRDKLRKKTNQMSQSRQSKDQQMKNQLEVMKENPLFSNAFQGTDEEKKKVIDMYASSVTKDSKQKKNIKKQLEKIMNNAELVV